MKPKNGTVKKYTMSELRELDDSQLDEIITSRKYLKEGDRPCADRGSKLLLIIDKQNGWR